MSEQDPRFSQRIPLVGGPSASPESVREVTSDERAIGRLGLSSAFELASAELGFVAASWLFVDQVAALTGEDGVRSLRDELGPSFSVLDFVASEWLEGKRRRDVKTSAIVSALEGIRRLVIVGIETRHIDAVVRVLPESTRIGLLTYRLQSVDWSRVVSNYQDRVEPLDVASFQGWSGARSAILTFIYGARLPRINVLPAFLRVAGPDVRTQFRDIIGWNTLSEAPEVYPRYLVETLSTDLTELIDETD